MNRFLVVEARRLLPLAFLLALLISLSVYDNFFRLEPVDTPPPVDEDFLYVTATRGEIDAPSDFKIAHTREQWEELQHHPDLDLPEYPFNQNYEIALCAVNSQVEDVEIRPGGGEVTEVLVEVASSPRYYHLVMLNRDELDTRKVHWIFMDEEESMVYEEEIEQDTEEPEPEALEETE